MSSITWSGNQLIQRVGKSEGELGKVAWDGNSETAVLWLKDTGGVLGAQDAYIRADEFASMCDAKEKAASAPSAFIVHCLWMRNSVRDQVTDVLENKWEAISSELDGDAKRNAIRERVVE